MLSFRFVGHEETFCLVCEMPTTHRIYRVDRTRLRWFQIFRQPIGLRVCCQECATYEQTDWPGQVA